LADVSGLNIIATDDVKARVTLRLVEVPWDQALDVVLQANGLEKSHSGNVLSVSTAKRLEEERNARLAARKAEQKLASLETIYLNINYVKATEIIELVTREATGGGTGGVALMSPRGSIAADSTSNVVIIRDTREHITAVQELVRNVDVQTPQVIIESYIVTASENIARDLGIQWGYNFAAAAATGNPTGVNFPGTVGLGGFGRAGTGGVPFIADFPAAAGAPTLDHLMVRKL
jgi:type IV pilus assembly protein PilQ